MLKKIVTKILEISKITIPEDGSPVPTGKSIAAYKPAPERMKDLSLDLPDMNPFTFDKDRPLLKKDSANLHWEYIEKIGDLFVGLSVLKDDSQNIYLALEYAVYLQLLDDGKSFLLYQHDPETKEDREYLTIHILKTKDLRPLNERQLLEFSKMKAIKVLYDANVEKTEIELKPDQLKFDFPFKGEITSVKEFFVVRNFNWIKSKSYGKTAILSIRPSEGCIEIFPQDWFNNSETIDFGYQWITMATRNPKTRKIHGFGIRLTNFILDASGRELDQGGDTSFF